MDRFTELNQTKKKEIVQDNFFVVPYLKKGLFSWFSTLAEKWVNMLIVLIAATQYLASVDCGITHHRVRLDASEVDG